MLAWSYPPLTQRAQAASKFARVAQLKEALADPSLEPVATGTADQGTAAGTSFPLREATAPAASATSATSCPDATLKMPTNQRSPNAYMMYTMSTLVWLLRISLLLRWVSVVYVTG